jgi:hypothetical protein
MGPAAGAVGGPHEGNETESHSNGRGAHGASEDSHRDRSYRGRGQSDRGGRYRTGGYAKVVAETGTEVLEGTVEKKTNILHMSSLGIWMVRERTWWARIVRVNKPILASSSR